MNFGEYQARLIDEPGYMGSKLFLYKINRGLGTEFLVHDGTVVLVKEGEVKDTYKLYFALLEDEQIHAIAEAFAAKGVKTQNDHKLAGLLEAKNDHLEDMRKLVFKGKQ